MELNELKKLIWIIILFLLLFFLPINNVVFFNAIYSMLDLIKWYAREHVILCLLPAFLIAGFISAFLNQASVLKYLGANTKKWISYSVASVSGSILAVCSCTVLPLFSSIHKKGAGLGPAIAFLYSGPAINILAIILTARIIGLEMGVARTLGAIGFSIVIGGIMEFIYRNEEKQKKEDTMNIVVPEDSRPFWQNVSLFFTLVLILVFANWGKPTGASNNNFFYIVWNIKWYLVGFFFLFLSFGLNKFFSVKLRDIIVINIIVTIAAVISIMNFEPKFQPLLPVGLGVLSLGYFILKDNENFENQNWILESWSFAKDILPLLLLGVMFAGFLLGSNHDGKELAGIIPKDWVNNIVGGNSLLSNFIASIVGTFMYFATLTEIPIIQGFLNAGMGKGPALALFLSGPSLSLPSILVIRKILGNEKTFVYVILVIVLSTLAGFIFGNYF